MEKKTCVTMFSGYRLHHLFGLLLIFILQSCFHKEPLLSNYRQTDLVANKTGYEMAKIDTTLLNAWGIAFGPSGIAWVNANGTGISELYDQNGTIVRKGINIPGTEWPKGDPGNPTGIVYNGSTDFKLNGKPAVFIFVSEDGVISGWNGGNTATITKNESSNAIYKGVALATDGGDNFLYAANFKTRQIDVFDKNWNKVIKPFNDPTLPAEYSPFNIQNIDNKLYVLYAKKIGDAKDEIKGAGNGFVDIYNADGSFASRFISNGALNAPWGITKAPAVFFDEPSNEIEDMILVGNFGDGRINVYRLNGTFKGALKSHGYPLVIPGLWGISFAPSTATQINSGKLFFAAGPAEEADGLFGYIEK